MGCCEKMSFFSGDLLPMWEPSRRGFPVSKRERMGQESGRRSRRSLRRVEANGCEKDKTNNWAASKHAAEKNIRLEMATNESWSSGTLRLGSLRRFPGPSPLPELEGLPQYNGHPREEDERG